MSFSFKTLTTDGENKPHKMPIVVGNIEVDEEEKNIKKTANNFCLISNSL